MIAHQIQCRERVKTENGAIAYKVNRCFIFENGQNRVSSQPIHFYSKTFKVYFNLLFTYRRQKYGFLYQLAGFGAPSTGLFFVGSYNLYIQICTEKDNEKCRAMQTIKNS